jgi:amidase
MAKQVAQTFGNERKAESTASQIAALNVKKREYQKEYMEYWNSTCKLNDLQEPVTAVIAPISTFAAPQPEKFNYYGKTQ